MAALNENTSKIQALIQDISNLPKDRYDEGYNSGLAIGEEKGKTTINSIVDRTITELNCDVENFGKNCFAYCDKLTKVKAPNGRWVYNSAFYSCTSLETFDISNPSANHLYFFAGAFNSASALKVMAIRATDVVATLQATSVFTDCPLTQGKGLILVPMDIIEQYQAATNWIAVGSTFRPIEMYTVDETVTGLLDEEAIAAFFNTLG